MLLGLSSFVPRNEKSWVFGSFGGSFNDNSKYLYLYITDNNPEILATWISGNKSTVKMLQAKGLKSYYKWSICGLYYSLTAKYYVYNSYVSDINNWTHGNTIRINLWHGIPIKKIEFDIKKGIISHIFNHSFKSKFYYSNHYTKPNLILSTSKTVSSLLASAFRVNSSQCLEYGYPRNDILFYSTKELIGHIKKYEPIETLQLIKQINSFNKTYVYMPTWRDDGSDFILDSKIDFNLLDKILRKNNELFILKLHNNTKLPVNLDSYNNISIFNNKSDIYPVLPFTDTLITDYSSICFDYKLMKKPVIFFCFDKERYIKNRDLYFDYDDIIKNELVANDFKELITIIDNKDSINYQNNQFFTKMTGKQSHNCSTKITNFIRQR